MWLAAAWCTLALVAGCTSNDDRDARESASDSAPLATEQVTTAASVTSTSAVDDAPATAARTELTDPPLPPCSSERRMVVTDIDETLTLSDQELIDQLGDPTYVPRARKGAAEMMRRYSDAGYLIAYVTARPPSLRIGSEPIRAATIDWLAEQGFPVGRQVARVYLMDTARYSDVRTYKGAAVAELVDAGWRPDVGYGNIDTDVLGFADGGVPLAQIYTIGKEAGVAGSVAIGDKGWRRHIAAVVADVEPFCARTS